MTDTKFTPGPWRVGDDDSLQQNGDLPILRDKTLIALTYSRRPLQSGGEEETRANAHLIAAAPELYAALKEARYELSVINAEGGMGDYSEQLSKFESTLAKARGEWSADEILEREG